MEKHTIAIILAAGCGKRMQSDVKKQYMLIKEKPILYHTLAVFENSFVDEIVVVASREEIEYCRKFIIEQNQFKKVTDVISGGKERYHSVYEALKWIKRTKKEDSIVFIHDAARPFVTEEILARAYKRAYEKKACIVGMPVKDTIKVIEEGGIVKDTPLRTTLWMVQTPQVFLYALIKSAYDKLFALEEMEIESLSITDDAMVVEKFCNEKICMVEGSYKNIKITTPEDLIFAETIM